MNRKSQVLSWGAILTTSVLVHAAAFGGLGAGTPAKAGPTKRPPTLVEMTVAPPPPPSPEPPRVAAVAPRVAQARPARKSAPPARPATPPPEAPEPVAETPADFTGLTLTNDGAGAGWASATGNGQAMNAPVGTPGAKVTGRSQAGAPERSNEPPVVGAGNLSRAPAAPELGEVLQRYYPPGARRKGQGGKAVVRARVMPDGQVRELALVTESSAGFGEACRRTLSGSRWSAPLDRNGRPVSTYIHYACRFEVQ